MSFVVDSSVALGWIYIDEITPATLQLSKRVNQSGAWVPAIWHLEIANSLQTSVRSGRIDNTFRDKTLADLSLFKITTDSEMVERAWSSILAITEQSGLTIYDACYIELAQRRALPLATLDRDVRKAARAFDINLLST